jgi:hypothetical protein
MGCARRARVAFFAAAMLALLVVGFVAATGAAAAGCSQQTVEVGIVKAIGSWTQSTSGGATIYTADFGQNPMSASNDWPKNWGLKSSVTGSSAGRSHRSTL